MTRMPTATRTEAAAPAFSPLRTWVNTALPEFPRAIEFRAAFSGVFSPQRVDLEFGVVPMRTCDGGTVHSVRLPGQTTVVWRWELDDREERTRIHCRVVHSERLRDLLGFNRARNAVLEAAILASRTAFLPPGDILRQLDELQVLVDKTGAEAEHRAFSLLRDHVEEARRRQAAGNETR